MGINICVSNDYWNGRIWHSLAAVLSHTAGYYDGLAAWHGVNIAIPWGLSFAVGSDTYHTRMVDRVPDGAYEITDAFHSLDTESFAWLDDSTDNVERAEVVRPVNDSAGVYLSTGGPTGTPLKFQSGWDWDTFLAATQTYSTYRFRATTASTDVDLCLEAYDWVTGAWLADSPGCWDGFGTPEARNATLEVSTGSARAVAVRVRNVLWYAGGTYDLLMQNLVDDFPDQAVDAVTAGALRPTETVSAVMNAAPDDDVFRYDSPGGYSGALTFTAAGLSSAPLLELYFSTGITPPGGSPIASGSGSVSVPSASEGHYWLYVRWNGVGGNYEVQTTHAGCSDCTEAGTYASPRPMPTAVGGVVINALPHGAGESGYETWNACETGQTCDWYEVALQQNERVTATTYGVASPSCALELSVLGPPEQMYFQFLEPGGARSPIVADTDGSSEPDGQQLTLVSRRAGTYRVRVRATGTAGGSRYNLAMLRGTTDPLGPPPWH